MLIETRAARQPMNPGTTFHAAPAIARCPKCKAAKRTTVNVWSVTGLFGHADSREEWPAISCDCGSARLPMLTRIVARRSSHACDARCIFATGSSCECSCGGKNHGAGH